MDKQNELKDVIIIPLDFTEQSIYAISQSYNLARYTNSKLLLLHVYEKQGEERFDEITQLTKKTQEESNVPCDFMNIKGNIYKETVRVAEEVKAKMIVVGVESHIKTKDILSDSASEMVRKSPCPIVTIRGREQRDGCENILLPIDLSRDSREKVDVAIEFARYFGAAIRILGLFSLKDEKYENQLHAYVHQVKQYIKAKGVTCSNKTMPSENIAETVVEYANKIETDLIVIMNKPGLSVREMFLGTMAQKVIDISNIPVMTINPKERESRYSSSAM
ncbi:MAG TPA: universal stress protein [Bacteroidia bacterium]|nr:universal stress protein [Bacteroidia bacterium]